MPIDYATFAHLTADKRGLYREVLRAFAGAKAQFILHLRPADVAAKTTRHDDMPEIEAALRQLVEWGNLSADPDTSEVSTVEEFYRARYFYRLTGPGEATERAIAVFEEGLERPGELQTAALGDIRDLLRELRDYVGANGDAPSDPAKVHLNLRTLWDRFDDLTDRAQVFVGNIQSTVELHGTELDAFIAYKDRLIEYLERFIGELVVAQAHIAALLRDLEERGVERLLDIAADRELADTLEPTEAAADAARATWRGRWAGIIGWFLPRGERQAQAELLRSRARAAIPALLQAITELNERRLSRSDRAADLRELARWFAGCDSDADAHRLWRSAFALSPARHLLIDQDTLDERDQRPVPSAIPWVDAPPVRISPRLRRTGRITRRGQPRRVIDRSEEKELLARLAAEEAAQVAAARRRLITREPIRLSRLGPLDPVAFDLFLDLLGSAFAIVIETRASVVAGTSDGSLEIELEPIGDGTSASIETRDGVLTGPDQRVMIRETFAGAGAA